MFTVSIIQYIVNKLESQWGWWGHVTLCYLQLYLIVRFIPQISKWLPVICMERGVVQTQSKLALPAQDICKVLDFSNVCSSAVVPHGNQLCHSSYDVCTQRHRMLWTALSMEAVAFECWNSICRNIWGGKFFETGGRNGWYSSAGISFLITNVLLFASPKM